MALSGAAGHHPQIVIPIALGQLGREEVGIALADQLYGVRARSSASSRLQAMKTERVSLSSTR